MTRKERLVREATTEILSEVYHLQEDEKRVRKILRKLYDDAFNDVPRVAYNLEKKLGWPTLKL